MSVKLEPIEKRSTVSSRGAASDSGLDDLATRALNAKRLKQAAVRDVQFLQNRLAKLKAEEFKALKEIEKTRKTTAEILHARKEFEEKQKQRQADAEREEFGKKKEAALLALQKEKQLKSVWDAKASLLQAKREKVASVKKEKELNLCRVLVQQDEVRERAGRTREVVRKQHEDIKSQREKDRDVKQSDIKKQFEHRVSREEREREELEKQATHLVQQEAQMIYRLKRMHLERQQAIKDLATATEVVNAEEKAAAMEAAAVGYNLGKAASHKKAAAADTDES